MQVILTYSHFWSLSWRWPVLWIINRSALLRQLSSDTSRMIGCFHRSSVYPLVLLHRVDRSLLSFCLFLSCFLRCSYLNRFIANMHLLHDRNYGRRIDSYWSLQRTMCVADLDESFFFFFVCLLIIVISVQDQRHSEEIDVQLKIDVSIWFITRCSRWRCQSSRYCLEMKWKRAKFPRKSHDTRHFISVGRCSSLSDRWNLSGVDENI